MLLYFSASQKKGYWLCKRGGTKRLTKQRKQGFLRSPFSGLLISTSYSHKFSDFKNLKTYFYLHLVLEKTLRFKGLLYLAACFRVCFIIFFASLL